METLVLVDRRQPSLTRQRLVQHGWQEETLIAGDYQWKIRDKVYGMEEKPTAGLVSSYLKIVQEGGRVRRAGLSELQDELTRLRENVDVPILFVPGGLPHATQGGLISVEGRVYQRSWWALGNFLTSAYLSGVIPVFGPRGQSVESVLHIVRYFTKLVHTALEDLPALKYKEATKPLAFIGIPGINRKLAYRLPGHFESPKTAVNADEESLRKIDGIGPILARAMYDYWKEW